MFEPRRQHPVAGLTQLLQVLKQNWITLLVLFFLGTGSESSWAMYALVGFTGLGAVGGIISWWRFTYQVIDGELQIKQGVFVRKQLYLSKERIQVIDISAGLVQRIFNLVSVEVKTAGSTSKEAKIDAITRSEAERIKHLLRSDEKVIPEDAAEPEQRVYRMGFKELFLAGLTSGNFGITLSIVGGAFSQIDQIIDEEQMMQFFEWLIPATASINFVFIVLLFVLIVSWIFSILGSLIKYYDFTLLVKKDELVIKRGLFEQKQLTVPFDRIQAIQIKEELLRQPLGYASIVLESAGYADDQHTLNSTTLFPFLKKSEVPNFIQEVIPEYVIETKTISPPPIALRRYILRMVWLSLIIIIPIWLFVPYGIISLALIAPMLLLGFAQYRDAEIGIQENTMKIQWRLLSRKTAIVKKHRVQAAEAKVNPFQRRLNLGDYEVTIASGNSGQTFGIRELDKISARKFLEWVSANSGEMKQSTID